MRTADFIINLKPYGGLNPYYNGKYSMRIYVQLPK